jgi:hypothetical protein
MRLFLTYFIDIQYFKPKLNGLLFPKTGSKLNYFSYIMSHDMIGEICGQKKFSEYLDCISEEDLP